MLALSVRVVTKTSLVFFLGALVLTSCSGGGDDDDPLAGVAVTVGIVDTTTYANFGVVCVPFTATGVPNSIIDIIAQYFLAPSGAAAAAAQAPAGLGTIPPSSNLVGVNLGANGTVTGTYYWAIGADLGFLPGIATFCLTPFSGSVPGTQGCSAAINYTGGQNSMTSSGGGAGTGTPGSPNPGQFPGRASHTATNIRPTVAPSSVKNLLVAGGYSGAATPNAFNTADRFNFATNGLSYTLPFNGPMVPGPSSRVLHASSFFLDPVTGIIKVLVTGGVNSCLPTGATLAARVAGATELNTASIYCFSPTEQVIGAMNMTNNRFGHTATWVPSNQVIIIGGASGIAAPAALSGAASIEHFNPVSQSFSGGPNMANLNMPRVEHTSTLLADGTILIAGGYNPTNPAVSLPAEIYNPVTGACSVVPGTPLNVTGHTSTRLANGWVVIVGGRLGNSSSLSAQSFVYRPEIGGFDPPITMDRGRALHAATLLGNRQVLISGGLASDSSNPVEQFTRSAQIFRVPDCFTPGAVTGFTPVNSLLEPRAEHSATAVDCGSIFIIGGRNNAGTIPNLNFLDSIEFYAFSNAVPVVTVPMTGASALAGSTMAVNFTVTDANQDGGYVVVRYRTTLGAGAWSNATIVSQTPSSISGNFPNHEVCPGNYSFIWNFGLDGVQSQQVVEIQIIPFGAVIGSAVSFTAQTP